MFGKFTVEIIREVRSKEPAIETLAEMYQCCYESVEVVGYVYGWEFRKEFFWKGREDDGGLAGAILFR